MISEEDLEAVKKLVGLERERRNYRNPVRSLNELGFPEKVGELLEADLDSLVDEGLLSSRYLNAEAIVRKEDAIEYEFMELKYYSFTEKLLDELDYDFETSEEVSDREKEFLSVLNEVKENSPTEGVPVSVIEALRPGEDSLEVEESFEDPLDLLESLNSKGFVEIESDSRGRLSRDHFYSGKLGEDVFTLSIIDRVYLPD